MRLSDLHRISLVGGVLLITSCSGPNGHADYQRLQSEFNSLSARVLALETEAASTGSWILWQRFDVIKTTAPLAGLAPARPMGAFSSKEKCEQSAQRTAERHGAKPGATEYLESTSFDVVHVFYSCLPKGVEVHH